MPGSGTREDPWRLTTPSGGGEYEAYRDEEADPPALVVQVGKIAAALPPPRARRPARRCSPGTATGCRWAAPTSRSRPPTAPSRHGRASEDNPVGGWYGLKKGMRGRFANYVPPVLEALGRAEVEHKPRGNRMRAG